MSRLRVAAIRCRACRATFPDGDGSLYHFMRTHDAHGLAVRRRSPGMPAGTAALACDPCRARRPVPAELGRFLIYHPPDHDFAAVWRPEYEARVLAALPIDPPRTVAEIAAAAGMTPRATRANLRKLESAGLAQSRPVSRRGRGPRTAAGWCVT